MSRRNNKRAAPRQWLDDRVHGVTLEGEDRPPSFLCFAPPVLKYFPSLLETNGFCRCLGRIGCCPTNDEWVRGAVLKVGASANVLGFLFALYAASALTENMSWLENGSEFARGVITETSSSDIDPVYIHVGLRAASFDNPNTFGKVVVPFDRFCEVADGGGLEKYLVADDCSECYDVSLQLLVATVLGVVAFVPTFAIDVLRFYSNFDVNCQKALSMFLSCITLTCFVLTYHQFTNGCLDAFLDGPTSYNTNGEYSPSGETVVNFNWKIGNGSICLLLAVGAKTIHLLCNCSITTPTITRNLEDQEDYERLTLEEDIWQ